MLWSERENQQDATVRCLFLTISQHVSLSLHNLLTMHGHRNLKPDVISIERLNDIQERFKQVTIMFHEHRKQTEFPACKIICLSVCMRY